MTRRTGIAHLPLHGGKAPAWLFQRMKDLAREIVCLMAVEHGTLVVLRRLADPFWFQAFGCVLGFDWHSSGLTTTTCGALKEGLREAGREIGLYVCGGKGGTSRKTPQEIAAVGDRRGVADPARLIYASRMAAKVDSAAVQDQYELYQHTFIFDRDGKWMVIQQGMNPQTGWARRYHWLGESVEDFVCEPHQAVCCDHSQPALNLVARRSADCRRTSTELAGQTPVRTVAEFSRLRELRLPARHPVTMADIQPRNLQKILEKTYERRPQNFEQLLGIAGLGAKTVRALAMIAELAYGQPASFEDPARFSFAHGGKDGFPYPVNRRGYDTSIRILKDSLHQSKLGQTDKVRALRRLQQFYQNRTEASV